jgi:hypothetical protein
MTQAHVQAVHATQEALRIVEAARELDEALAGADPEQALFGVMIACAQLIDAYFRIADLNKTFKLVCEGGDREPALPLYGMA